MMRLNRARWLRQWAESGPSVIYCRGIGELRAWMFERGYIVYPGAYALRVTDEGRAALEKTIEEHARHGRPNLLDRPVSKPSGARAKGLAETLAQVKTYAVLEGEPGPILESLRPARLLPNIHFVEPTMGEALSGQFSRDVMREIATNTTVGGLVIAYGVLASAAAVASAELGRRALVVVSLADAEAAKLALGKLAWRREAVAS